MFRAEIQARDLGMPCGGPAHRKTRQLHAAHQPSNTRLTTGSATHPRPLAPAHVFHALSLGLGHAIATWDRDNRGRVTGCAAVRVRPSCGQASAMQASLAVGNRGDPSGPISESTDQERTGNAVAPNQPGSDGRVRKGGERNAGDATAMPATSHRTRCS